MCWWSSSIVSTGLLLFCFYMIKTLISGLTVRRKWLESSWLCQSLLLGLSHALYRPTFHRSKAFILAARPSGLVFHCTYSRRCFLLCRNSLTCPALLSEIYKTATRVSTFRRTLLPWWTAGCIEYWLQSSYDATEIRAMSTAMAQNVE